MFRHCDRKPYRSLYTLICNAGICIAGLCFSLFDSCAFAQEPAAATEASHEQVEILVQQLDDDHYDVRQRAQQSLENLEHGALDSVVDAASDGTLESVTRAVTILMNWSESKDQEFRLKVLEKMANLTNRPREAAMASRLLAEVREMAAMATLQKLGAEYERLGVHQLRFRIDSKWTGGSEGLKHFADVPRAVLISFVGAPIDDSALQHLSGLKNLQRVEFYSTKVTRAAADELKKQAPFNVDFRQALLGVKGMPNGQCKINHVEPNSAAEKAGLVPGDEITEFNGEAVQDFGALTDKIKNFKAGESATLTIVRESSTQQVKVTFGDWRDTKMNQLNSRLKLQIGRNQNRIIIQNKPVKVPNPREVPVATPKPTAEKAESRGGAKVESEGAKKQP